MGITLWALRSCCSYSPNGVEASPPPSTNESNKAGLICSAGLFLALMPQRCSRNSSGSSGQVFKVIPVDATVSPADLDCDGAVGASDLLELP